MTTTNFNTQDNETILLGSLQARAAHLAATCDGGQILQHELDELARDLKALNGAIAPCKDPVFGYGGRLDDVAAELESLSTIAEMATNQLGTDKDAVGILDVLTRECDRLNRRVGEISEELRERRRYSPADAETVELHVSTKRASSLSPAENREVSRLAWLRLKEFERANAERPVEDVMRELERGQWDVFDRGYDADMQDRYLLQHSWSRTGLDEFLALQHLLESIHPDDDGGEA